MQNFDKCNILNQAFQALSHYFSKPKGNELYQILAQFYQVMDTLFQEQCLISITDFLKWDSKEACTGNIEPRTSIEGLLTYLLIITCHRPM